MSRKFIIFLVLCVSVGKGILMSLDAPASPPAADSEFTNGSRIQLVQLTPLQIGNLAILGQVWGFLKYHDPVVTRGTRSWDLDLFRVVPGVLAADNRAESNALLAKWIDSLGPIDICDRCASLDSTVGEMKPDISWIGDTEYLGVPLAHRLESIYHNRIRDQQYYLGQTKLGNPTFGRESSYRTISFPDSGYQLLGLFRFWNIVEYWSPYRNLVGEDWRAVLVEFIPRIACARDKRSYAREMMALIARLHDSHANLWSSLDVRPPAGRCRLPVDLRFIEHRAIVTGFTADPAGNSSGLEVGDEITALDGVAVNTLINDWAPFYADSNEAAQLRDMARNLTNGVCGPARVEVRRNGALSSLPVTRLDASQAGAVSFTHDLPGPTFRLLSRDVSYLKLSSVDRVDVPSYIMDSKGTRGLIVDIRNYPSEFVVFALGSLLIDKRTPFVLITAPDLSNPGAFHRRPFVFLEPSEPHYDGKVVILVDEVTQSQAEFTAMAFRSVPNAVVIGSTTTGADGDVSGIPLPGALYTAMSGLGVFYPAGTPTQRVGLHVDVEVHPTVPGIREGRDEVLEVAIRQIVPMLSLSEVEKLARPNQSRNSATPMR
jgi:C-terminal processing protease CtpA/Prc